MTAAHRRQPRKNTEQFGSDHGTSGRMSVPAAHHIRSSYSSWFRKIRWTPASRYAREPVDRPLAACRRCSRARCRRGTRRTGPPSGRARAPAAVARGTPPRSARRSTTSSATSRARTGPAPPPPPPARARANRRATSSGVPPTVLNSSAYATDQSLHPRTDRRAAEDDRGPRPLDGLREQIGALQLVVACPRRRTCRSVSSPCTIATCSSSISQRPSDVVERRSRNACAPPPTSPRPCRSRRGPADVVDRHGRLREDRRFAERHRRHERAEPQPFGARRERPEDRPRVGRTGPRGARGAEVVVRPEQPLEAEPLGRPRPARDQSSQVTPCWPSIIRQARTVA